MELPENRESRPTRAEVEAASISTAIKIDSSVASAIDPHCCAALTLDERMTAARFAIHCAVDRCARTVLRGEDR
ncbi:hypothetical protein GCM10009606_36360 [Nocardioides aquiterrae]|uniref:Uncharacterized protein n=1 Tax=Nocardioides aquiterrae TaxID=203799 RepID=A0ABP4F7T3_9ACTN